jgi:hypothetical protein
MTKESQRMPGCNSYNSALSKIQLIGGMFLIIACSQVIMPNPQNEGTAPSIETQQTSVTPTQGNSSPMTHSLPTPDNASLQTLIEKTKEDLANRLVIPTEEISFAEITEAEWSDASLGCPQPGMDYLQVITPGYRILLEVNTQIYEYHSNRDTYVVYCQDSIPPIFPKP